MSNYDSDILIQNIKSHMIKKGTTQEKLAEVLGMSQSNVSKALSSKDKKSFTFDQIIGIAKFFKVSVDSLIGEKETSNISMTPRSIAAFLAQIIESHKAELFIHEVEEDIYEYNGYSYPPSVDHFQKKVPYPTIYLPSYWHIPSNCDPNEEVSLMQEMAQVGNESDMKAVNLFLKRFYEIFQMYENNGLSEDTYRSVLSNLLDNLRD